MIKVSKAFDFYQTRVSKQEYSNIRSIVSRRILDQLLEFYNLQALQHQSLDYLFEQIPLAGFFAIAEPILQNQLLQVSNPATRKVEKSQWKRFGTEVQSQEWYVPEPEPFTPSAEETKPSYTHIPRGTLQAVSRSKRASGKSKERFGLLEQDFPPHLRAQIQSFDHFYTTVTRWRRQAVSSATLEIYHQAIQKGLSFRKNVQGIAPDALDLTDLVDLSVLEAYEKWRRDQGAASQTIKLDLRVAVPVAQWHFAQTFPGEDYRNSEPVKTVRRYLRTIVDYGDRPQSSDEACAERALSMDECWEMLKYLSWRCKDLEKQYGLTNQVIDAWMDYLILAFLVTTGARQREIREMTTKQLSVEENNIFIVTLPPEGHKNGRKTGKGRAYPLFVGPMRAALSDDLRHYLNHIRPQNLGHDFLFFIRQNASRQGKQARRGDPIRDAKYLSYRLPNLIAVITAHLYGVEKIRWTAPHDFRRIIATWVCTYGKPEHLAIYAELLGHSMEMLVKLYNKMHPGALARQTPLAYEEIFAQQERVKALNTPGASKASISIAHMTSTALIELLKKLVKKLWQALTKRKQSAVFEALTPSEREVIEE